jgi:tetraacyldisaccharide 4'-kinase
MTAQRAIPPGFSAHDRRGEWIGIISASDRSLAAGLARAGLTVLSGLYRAGLAACNLRYRLPGAVERVPCPVVSVGNLTVGGTGKTPMVAYLARLALDMGLRPVIISRGYGAEKGQPNEEALELARLCPGVPHLQHPNRAKALRRWLASGNPCDVAILDDGFQHRRLARDLDIVLIDALNPFGYGHLLPRGLLREPPSALRRADLVVITRGDLADDSPQLKEAIARHTRPNTPIVVAAHDPTGLVLLDGSRRDVAWLKNQKVAAACGLGNPEGFRRTLARAGARVQQFTTFPDHYAYTAGDLTRLVEAARSANVTALVTTGKDYVKWQPLLAAGPPLPVAALEVAFKVLEGEQALRSRVGWTLRRRP